MSTPIYDELEEKWNWTINQRNICDRWWTVTHTATGQEWLEDDEGNEVFPEPSLEKIDLTVLRESLRAEEEAISEILSRADPKRKFKLFGRNQETRGTL